MGGNDSTIDIINMLLQITYFLSKLFRQTIACRIWDVDHRGTGLNDSLYDTSQILIIRAAGILGIELDIVHKTARILHRSYSSLKNLLTRAIELELDMLVTCADTGMDTFVLGILQRFGCHVNIALYSSA